MLAMAVAKSWADIWLERRWARLSRCEMIEDGASDGSRGRVLKLVASEANEGVAKSKDAQDELTLSQLGVEQR